MRDILKHGSSHSREVRGNPTFQICDALAMAVAVDPSIVTKQIKSCVRVELRGEVSRGQMVKIDTGWRDFHPSEGAMVNIILELDAGAFQGMLMKAVE